MTGLGPSGWTVIGGGFGDGDGGGQERIMRDRERERATRQRNILLGLSPDGFAHWQSPDGSARGNYDPRDSGDVARVRRLLAAHGVDNWQPVQIED